MQLAISSPWLVIIIAAFACSNPSDTISITDVNEIVGKHIKKKKGETTETT